MREGRSLLLLGFSGLGLFLYGWAFYGQVQKSALPPGFDREGLVFPVRVEQIVAARPEQVRFLVEGWPQGASLELVQATGSRISQVLVPAESRTVLLITCLSGLFFWGVGAFVFAPRWRRPGVMDFFLICFLYGFSIMIGGVFFTRELLSWRCAFNLAQLACLAFLPPLFIHLALTFPRRSHLLHRLPWLMPGLWLVAAGLATWQGWVYCRYFQQPGPDSAAALVLPQQLADISLVTQFAAGCCLLYLGHRRLELTREKKQVRWLFWGFAIGAAPYALLRTLPLLLGLTPLLPASADRILEIAMPTAFVFAVVRHQFLDIDIIIRRSLLYAVLASLLVALYLGLGVAVGRRVDGDDGGLSWMLLLVIGLMAGIGFNPLRRAIGGLIDRTLFKMEHDLDQSLRMFRHDLTQVPSQVELADSLARSLTTTLSPRRLLVMIPHGQQWQIAGADGLNCGEQLHSALSGLTGGLTGTVAAPDSTSLPELERDDFPDVVSEAGFCLANVFAIPDGAGLVLLGPRQTERRYIAPDITYVQGCVTATARALERIRLVQAVEAATSARHRLDELNRLKNDFLSRVAHDLRTPLASISWSAANLLDGIAGDLEPRQREYLESVHVAVELLNRLVGNLFDISRLEQGKLPFSSESVVLAPLLERAILAVKPLAVRQRVRVVVDGAEVAPPIWGNGEKLTEVVVNLLENAIRFSPPDQEVVLTVTMPAQDRVQMTVRDHGPGIDLGEINVLFDQYEQGSPSPYSQPHGFGLGLYIVKSYLEAMAGEVSAANHPEGGALFTIRFKLYRVDAGGEG